MISGSCQLDFGHSIFFAARAPFFSISAPYGAITLSYLGVRISIFDIRISSLRGHLFTCLIVREVLY